MNNFDISKSVAIPVELKTRPVVSSKASEELADSFRRKYAPIKSSLENADMINSSSLSSAIVISEDELTGDLPAGYGETRVVIQARDPHLAWVYWEFSTEEKNRLEKELGMFEYAHTELSLRVFNETMNYMFEIKLPKECDNWFLALNDSNCDYSVKLCANAPSLGTIVLATSTTAHTPTDRASEKSAKWVDPRPEKVKSGMYECFDCSDEAFGMTAEPKFIENVTIEGAYLGSSEKEYRCLEGGCFSVSSDCVVNTNR